MAGWMPATVVSGEPLAARTTPTRPTSTMVCKDVGQRGGGVLEVRLAIGEVGHREEGGLDGDATHRVGHRQAGLAGGGGVAGGDDPRQRRGGPARARRRATASPMPGAVGESIDGAGEGHAHQQQRRPRRHQEQHGDRDRQPGAHGPGTSSPSAPPRRPLQPLDVAEPECQGQAAQPDHAERHRVAPRGVELGHVSRSSSPTARRARVGRSRSAAQADILRMSLVLLDAPPGPR